MNTVKDVLEYMDTIAPFNSAMKWDNVGLLVGDKDMEVTGCILALDATIHTLEFAIEENANLIITHHPVIFGGLKNVTSDSLIYKLIQNNISVISAHTNLDIAEGGVNYALADALKLKNQRQLENPEGLGRVGELEKEMTPLEFANHLRTHTPSESVNYTNYDKPIKTVAVVGGEGSDFAFVCEEADAYVSGEIKHHIFIEAQNRQKQIFAVGHYESEISVLDTLAKKMLCKFDCFKSQTHLICNTRHV